MSFYNLSSFYTSKEWKQFREILLLERTTDGGDLISDYSGKPLVNKFDIILHHKIELTEANVFNYDISLNPDNIMVVSHAEHNEIHSRFGYNRQQVWLVYGSPCSGKTTWVHNVAGRGDIIVDIDNIWEAVSTGDRYEKPGRLKANVFALHKCLLDQIRTRQGDWVNAYVIQSSPYLAERARFYDKFGARGIYIPTDKETCLQRALERPTGWDKFVEEFWEKFQPDPPTL